MELRDDEPPAIGVRIGVRNAGCSGMTYSMDQTQTNGRAGGRGSNSRDRAAKCPRNRSNAG